MAVEETRWCRRTNWSTKELVMEDRTKRSVAPSCCIRRECWRNEGTEDTEGGPQQDKVDVENEDLRMID
jgi:hypothetical protein